jgi:hypothetical protein
LTSNDVLRGERAAGALFPLSWRRLARVISGVSEVGVEQAVEGWHWDCHSMGMSKRAMTLKVGRCRFYGIQIACAFGSRGDEPAGAAAPVAMSEFHSGTMLAKR